MNSMRWCVTEPAKVILQYKPSYTPRSLDSQLSVRRREGVSELYQLSDRPTGDHGVVPPACPFSTDTPRSTTSAAGKSRSTLTSGRISSSRASPTMFHLYARGAGGTYVMKAMSAMVHLPPTSHSCLESTPSRTPSTRTISLL